MAICIYQVKWCFNIKTFFYLGITKLCTQLHLPPFISTQLILTSTQLISASMLLEPKYWMQLGNFPKFRPEKSKCSVLPETGTHDILRMMTLLPTLVFWIFNPKSISGQIWAKKVKVVRFAWKLAHMVSPGC